MFDHISKHLKVPQKRLATRGTFNFLLSVWKCSHTFNMHGFQEVIMEWVYTDQTCLHVHWYCNIGMFLYNIRREIADLSLNRFHIFCYGVCWVFDQAVWVTAVQGHCKLTLHSHSIFLLLCHGICMHELQLSVIRVKRLKAHGFLIERPQLKIQIHIF